MLSEFPLNIVQLILKADQYLQCKWCRDFYQFQQDLSIVYDKRLSFTPFGFYVFFYGFSIDVTADHLLQSFTKPLNIKGAAEAPSSINSAVRNDSKTSTSSLPHGGSLLGRGKKLIVCFSFTFWMASIFAPISFWLISDHLLQSLPQAPPAPPAPLLARYNAAHCGPGQETNGHRHVPPRPPRILSPR